MTVKKISSVFAVAAALILCVTGCTTAEKSEANAPGELAGSVWKPVGAPKTAFIEFTSDNRVVGCSGLNRFFGPVSYARGKRIRLGPLAATKMVGPNLQYEDEFFAKLDAVRGYVLDNDTLTLYSEERQPLLELKPANGALLR